MSMRSSEYLYPHVDADASVFHSVNRTRFESTYSEPSGKVSVLQIER